jgi:glucuronate isomerase
VTYPFISDLFLLQNETGRMLYEYARNMPVFDYHCHLSVDEIVNNKNFENITRAWLGTDHYKWRAMRANGVDERFITGNASDREKFHAWAQTLPHLLRNPLFHWTYLELKAYFGIEDISLNSSTADMLYEQCNELLRTESFTVRQLLIRANVRVLCTTDDPADTLDQHGILEEEESFPVRVVPSFRPDPAFLIDLPAQFNMWVDRLEESSRTEIGTLDALISALLKRQKAFHEAGCRSSDHGIEFPYSSTFTELEVEKIFDSVRSGKAVSQDQALLFKSYLLRMCAEMNARMGWVMQLHIGALRNNNTRMYRNLGPDSGFDSMGDFEIARPLIKFLDDLDEGKMLPKTVLFNINPRDNALIASVAGCFQEGPVPGKVQFGPAWWFNDTKDGIIRQLNTLSEQGLFSRFIGMTTDSRSFFSFSRHDYFRRILCSLIGGEVESGELPDDTSLLRDLVEDICYHNARRYFGIETGSFQ